MWGLGIGVIYSIIFVVTYKNTEGCLNFLQIVVNIS